MVLLLVSLGSLLWTDKGHRWDEDSLVQGGLIHMSGS